MIDVPFTRTQWELLPEGFPAELVEGELCHEPAPRYGHQRLAARIHQRLVALAGPDLVPLTPVDILVDTHNIFEPDLVVLRERPADNAQYVGIPLLVIEVLSPSTARRDRTIKKTRLLAAGVEEVWIVDPAQRRVEIHRRDRPPEIVRGDGTAHSTALPGFGLTPTALFSE